MTAAVMQAEQLVRHYRVRQGPFQPAATVKAPVSYTHLTLPTKRIV